MADMDRIPETKVTIDHESIESELALAQIADQVGWLALWQYAADKIKVSCRHGWTSNCPHCAEEERYKE